MVGRTIGISLEGKGSEGENVLFDLEMTLEISSQVVGEKEDKRNGGLGGWSGYEEPCKYVLMEV